MWEWLWERLGKPPQKPPTPRPPKAEPLPQNKDEPKPEQILVRGKAWKNTVADPAPQPQPETPPALDISELLPRLRHKDTTVRQHTAEVLGLLGPKAQEAI